jgi:hypothetical protein
MAGREINLNQQLSFRTGLQDSVALVVEGLTLAPRFHVVGEPLTSFFLPHVPEVAKRIRVQHRRIEAFLVLVLYALQLLEGNGVL